MLHDWGAAILRLPSGAKLQEGSMASGGGGEERQGVCVHSSVERLCTVTVYMVVKGGRGMASVVCGGKEGSGRGGG